MKFASNIHRSGRAKHTIQIQYLGKFTLIYVTFDHGFSIILILFQMFSKAPKCPT